MVAKGSASYQTIGAIGAGTWEAVNRTLPASAKQDRPEAGAGARLDGTASAALMHEPSDSMLLGDAVRIMTRLLRRAAAQLFHRHSSADPFAELP